MAQEPRRITVSALVTASRCLVCFYETHVLKRPKRAGPHLIFGRALHRAIELYEQSGRSLRAAIAALEVFGKALSPEKLDEGRRILAAFHASERARPGRTRYVEHPIQCAVGPLAVFGRIDRVDEFVGAWGLVEYKTGRHPDLAAARLQCAAYALALVQTYGVRPETWTVHLLSTGEKRKLETAEEPRSLLAPTCELVARQGWGHARSPRCSEHRGQVLQRATVLPPLEETQRTLFPASTMGEVWDPNQ